MGGSRSSKTSMQWFFFSNDFYIFEDLALALTHALTQNKYIIQDFSFYELRNKTGKNL